MNLPVHDEIFISPLLSFLFLNIDIIVLFIYTTDLKLVYEISIICLGFPSIN